MHLREHLKKLYIILICGMVFLIAGCQHKPDTETEYKAEEREPVIEDIEESADEEQSVIELPDNTEHAEEPAQNNGGLFVTYNGYTYYREYTADSYEETGIGHDYQYVPDSPKSMMRVSSTGEKEVLFEDNGSGAIFIYNDRMYLSDTFGNSVIYSVDFDGNNRTDHVPGRLLDLDTQRGVMVVEILDRENNMYGIYGLLCEPDAEPYLISSDYYITYDSDEGIIYTWDHTEVSIERIILKAVSIDRSNELELCVTPDDVYKEREEYEVFYTTVHFLHTTGDYLYFSYGYWDSRRDYYQGRRIARVRKDGSDFEDLVGVSDISADEDFYVQSSDEKDVLVYREAGERKELNLLTGQCSDATMWPIPVGEIFYISEESAYNHSDISAEEDIYVYMDMSGVPLLLYEASDLETVRRNEELLNNEDTDEILTDIQYDDTYSYFTYVIRTFERDMNTAWRDSFHWEYLAAYRRNLTDGTIERLYEIHMTEEKQTGE